MKRLIDKSKRKVQGVTGSFKRYLYHKIDWTQRLIVILGYRGVGKTTLLLQYLAQQSQKGIYISLDDLYFESHRLYETVHELYLQEYRLFVLDEVHQYAFWSKDLKQLYDDFDDIQIVATGSSILDIQKGSADLSRRSVVYTLNGLSFREFLEVHRNIKIAEIPLLNLIEQHHKIAPELLDTINFPEDFEDYLHYGYFPFFMEGKNSYYQKVQETFQLVINSDIAPYEELQYSTVRTMKKLLFVISQSVPFTPNIQKLAEKLETTRNTVLKLLDILQQAQLILLLKSSTQGVSYLQKPEKIYLNNTNFIHVLSGNQPNMGSIRETFFFNQLSVNHQVTASKYGDFLIDDTYVFEVGGASKSSEQIKGVPNAYLALDIHSGNQRRIPLWLFGLLY
jgi:predicted AAA+ superfamily ATPase